MALNVEHTSPQPDKYPQVHTLSLTNEQGETVGKAEFLYFGKPFRFYYLFFIGVPQPFRGEGFGSSLLKQVNTFLDTRKSPGLLRNIIDPTQPTHSIYTKYGWAEDSRFEGWYLRNLHNGDERKIARAIARVKKVEQEGTFYHQ